MARGDGKQDWEKEPYPFEVEIVGIFSNGFRYSTNSPVRVWDNWGNSYDIKNMDVEVDFDKDNSWKIKYTSSPDFFRQVSEVQESKRDEVIIHIEQTDKFDWIKE